MALGESPSNQQPLRGSGGGGGGGHDEPNQGGTMANPPPPQSTMRLWGEVATGIDKSQTVVWKNAVDSLNEAYRFLLTSAEAREFTETYMKPVISILLEQQPSKIGQMEKNCVEESLRFAVMIVIEDLKFKAEEAPAGGSTCKVLEVLAMIFNRKKSFYKGTKPSWNVSYTGLPEVRLHMISRFRSNRGFKALAAYLKARIATPHFPPLDILHFLLNATLDAIPNYNSSPDQIAKFRQIEDELISVARSVMNFLEHSSEDSLKRQTHESLNLVRYDLQRIFDRLVVTRRADTYSFYAFWRALSHKLLTSQSLPLKLFAWEQVNELIEASKDMTPPPKAFIVSNAGCKFVNGKYLYAGDLTQDGYARSGSEVRYELDVPDKLPENQGGGKKLTLFRCTMRSQQKWWFLSEADEEQPGTDKDIDYYQHKSKQHEENEPPARGWVTCRIAGVEPPPTLAPSGLMVPDGQEYNTLEHQLAKWAIENDIIELVLGDSIHREIVARSTQLIRFLASMCTKDDDDDEIAPGGENSQSPGGSPNAYCLQISHLLLAWKTCTSKADAAVSSEVYQLLVSILPELPSALAIPLLDAIKDSLEDKSDNGDYLFEVAEFCGALASSTNMDADGGGGTATGTGYSVLAVVSKDARAAILNLLWSVLTHHHASSLKGYDRLKAYVMAELREDPMDTQQRETFLRSCKEVLSSYSKLSSANGGDGVDEAVALRSVKLTQFVLEACPNDQAVALVTKDSAALATLLFHELTAYLNRRTAAQVSRRLLLPGNTPDSIHPKALSERLHFMRYAYGLSDRANMSSQQLDHMWSLCQAPGDREALMIFLAKAANAEPHTSSIGVGDSALLTSQTNSSSPIHSTSTSLPLFAAFSDEVCVYAFQSLICSKTIDWGLLGEGAYQSFYMLFKRMRRPAMSSLLTSNGPALDALWRICLTAGNDDVASQAMEDLLATYSSAAVAQPEESFAQRIFECLVKVKEGLEAGDLTFERSAERCLRILNSAIGHNNGGGGGVGVGDKSSTISSTTISSIASSENIADVLRVIPHGMRGQAYYRTIGIMAKRPSQPAHHAVVTSAAAAAAAGLSTSSSSTTGGDEVGVSTTTTTGHGNVGARLKVSERFTLNVHPLESLSSINKKVAKRCNHQVSLVKPISVSGGRYRRHQAAAAFSSRRNNNDQTTPMSLSSVVPNESLVVQLGITDGCEIVYLLALYPIDKNSGSTSSSSSSAENKKGQTTKKGSNNNNHLDLSEIFSDDDDNDGTKGSADRFFETLLDVLEALPVRRRKNSKDVMELEMDSNDTHQHVWDLLLSMPTNLGIVDRVRSAAFGEARNDDVAARSSSRNDDAMSVDTPRRDDEWSELLDCNSFHRSVYVMQVIDSYLQPAPEILSSTTTTTEEEKSAKLQADLTAESLLFRKSFIESGGFEAVLRFFAEYGTQKKKSSKRHRSKMGNAFALRILKCCFFGNKEYSTTTTGSPVDADNAGRALLNSLSNAKDFLYSLTSVVIDDAGVSDSTILDVLQILRLLLLSGSRARDLFSSLDGNMTEKVLIALLLWEGQAEITVTNVNSASKIRKVTEELILQIPSLARSSLPWLIKALESINFSSESTEEFFAVIIKLVDVNEGGIMSQETRSVLTPTTAQCRDLATAVCKKLASHPRPSNDFVIFEGVLCGCLRLLRALIENGGATILGDGVDILIRSMGSPSWCDSMTTDSKDKGLFDMIASSFRSKSVDSVLINLMGSIFDRFLASSDASTSSSICREKESRRLGFEVISAAVRACKTSDGYYALTNRINNIVSIAAPSLRHRWGPNVLIEECNNGSRMKNDSKYSGLRNQGCTCYMNSVLQQLFMMPELQKNLCSATLPSSLRSSGGGQMAKGTDLVGKRISTHWDSGVSYEATVLSFDERTGMHTIRYEPLQSAVVGGQQAPPGGMGHQQTHPLHPDNVAGLPKELPDEFFLTEGRPGKETGVFDILSDVVLNKAASGESSKEVRSSSDLGSNNSIQETEDEASSRRLLEEVQRTFVHLDEGSRGRCFDPRALVEASACLKLEFDVWQQNDASEFAMKLLDRLEVALKRWSPKHFKFLEHTFGTKQTKQKICKECGLKTNREEHLLNIDCQIRGKSDIHEALSTMCEVEYMEGDNRVFCDRCKKKCDTVLRTAISELPDMLVLSLKRFDLDYNTFETVKLNSRCAFGQTLNMKRYTLEGVEEEAKASDDVDVDMDSGDEPMESEKLDPPSSLQDEDYEYRLVGVLVHAGVAQGGHYYSFIKDRITGNGDNEEKWYRFDDEDVTPFDPSSIETECFGGKVKKETKWPNGQVHTVESEQFANALMLFYKKVKPIDFNERDEADSKVEGTDKKRDEDSVMNEKEVAKRNIESSSGYGVFQPDVRRSNTSHNWESFLFDAEFQSFLNRELDSCLSRFDKGDDDSMDISTPASSPSPQDSSEDDSNSSWRLALLQLSLRYVFDVALHSAERNILDEWAKNLASLLDYEKEGARRFVHELARRTHLVNGNWLRTYCADCPEESSRVAAVRIIAAAVGSCATFTEEQQALSSWTSAWISQVQAREEVANRRSDGKAMPTELEGKWKLHENIGGLESGSSSSIGIIFATLILLLEVAPRSWRCNSELCMLLRDIVCVSSPSIAKLLRTAMIEAQIPARLICLAIRDKSPPQLRVAFPGASASFEVAEALIKPETTLSSHILPLGGGAVEMGTNVGSPAVGSSMPNASDHLSLLEALGCIMGIEGIKREELVKETGNYSKGRPILSLSKAAKDALAVVFQESATSPVGGMDQRDIQNYMKSCGVDVSTVSPQRIANILNKYPTTVGLDGDKETRYLNLDGFLAYYRDTAQTNEAQVRSDLRTFGFRPDLSRRSESARFYVTSNSQGEKKRSYQSVESIALDVADASKHRKLSDLGKLAEAGLMSYHMHTLSYSACEYLAEYIIAAGCYRRDTSRLLTDSLRAFHRAPTGWAGNEIYSACVMIFKILAALPDDKQQDRISAMMQSTERAHPHSETGVGLLVAAKEFSSMNRASQHYSNDYSSSSRFERYVDGLKELQKQHDVQKWMSEHRSLWVWMEQWLRTDHGFGQQGRGDLDRRDGSVYHSSSVPLTNHSDSEVNGVMGDSDEEDEDSRYCYSEGGAVIVQGAGVNAVNGVYKRSGTFDNVGKYSKEGIWKENVHVFSLFRCRLSDNTRRWYISIVPDTIQPGTNKDIDFYSAPIVQENHGLPPEYKWSTAKDHGSDPPPTLRWRTDRDPLADEDQSDGGGRMWSGDGEEGMEDDVEDAGQMNYPPRML